MFRLLTPVVLFATLPAAAADPGAFDWPQWRGQDRDGLSKETGLLQDWPADGPKQVWKITGLGEGYSTPTVSAGRIYVLGTKGNDEFMICLNEKDGTRVWDARIGPKAGVQHGGPRSSPTVSNKFAYAVSSAGVLACVGLDKGDVKWQKDYRKEFGGRHGIWAYAESPLVDGDWVIGTPGSPSAGLAAFNKDTGAVVWKTEIKGLAPKPPKADPKRPNKRPAPDYSVAGYSSVIIAEFGGIKQYVQFISGGVIGVSANDGRLLWHYEEPANATANITTPIVRGDLVFAVSSYGTGGGQAKIVKAGDDFKAEPAWFNERFQNHHGGVVLVKDHLYGTSNAGLMCVDFKTGKLAWQERSVGKGSVTFADGRLYVRGENGKVALVEANPEKYGERGRFDQPDRSDKPAWPHPVVANGKLYLRDWDILLCYDVKGK